MNYIYIGKIVNTHGIKGEIRILSDFKYKERALKKGKTIYIGTTKIKEEINSYRKHKIFDMITLCGINNINDVLKYKGQKVYTVKENLDLLENEYLDSDLIGLTVLVNHQEKGIVKNYLKDKYQDKLVVNKEGIDYLVPYVCDIIENINLTNKTISIKEIKGLLD